MINHTELEELIEVRRIIWRIAMSEQAGLDEAFWNELIDAAQSIQDAIDLAKIPMDSECFNGIPGWTDAEIENALRRHRACD